MRKWIIEEAHNSNWLVECEYDSREEAEYNLKEIEECDKRNGEYKPNRYRIAEIETENDGMNYDEVEETMRRWMAEDEIRDLKEEIEKYKEDIEAVYARNRELEEIVYRLRNEVEALKEERTFLEAVTANSDNEIMKLKAKLYDLMAEKGENK